MTKTNYDYWNIKKRADQTVSDEVRRFINGEIDPDGNEVPESDRVKLQGVWLQPSSKRYYLYGSLASGVLGFVNSDGVGSVGLEAKYDDTLTGTAGYTISARNAAGTELMYNYEQIFDAENGHSLVLTLDANVQMSLENGLESMLKKYGAKNGGTGIVMDVNSGAIVAMASYPNYDLNDYGTIFDDALKTKLDTELAKIDAKRSTYESEEAYAEARSAAINSAVQSLRAGFHLQDHYAGGGAGGGQGDEKLHLLLFRLHPCAGLEQGHLVFQPQRPRSADPHRGGGPFLQPCLYQHGSVRGNGDLLQVSEILRPDG